jgi:hypothetical protein
MSHNGYHAKLESQPTLGSVNTTDVQKRKYAGQSLEANMGSAIFRKLFPELVALHHKRVAELEALKQSLLASEEAGGAAANGTAAGQPAMGGIGGLANAVAKDKHVLQDHALVAYGCVGSLLLAVIVLYFFS